MRIIDADALVAMLKSTYCDGCDNYAGVRCKACPNDDEIGDIERTPTIKTKEIKYYDDDESVWKIGRVIVDETD